MRILDQNDSCTPGKVQHTDVGTCQSSNGTTLKRVLLERERARITRPIVEAQKTDTSLRSLSIPGILEEINVLRIAERKYNNNGIGSYCKITRHVPKVAVSRTIHQRQN